MRASSLAVLMEICAASRMFESLLPARFIVRHGAVHHKQRFESRVDLALYSGSGGANSPWPDSPLVRFSASFVSCSSLLDSNRLRLSPVAVAGVLVPNTGFPSLNSGDGSALEIVGLGVFDPFALFFSSRRFRFSASTA